MPPDPQSFPKDHPRCFRATVHGLAFAGRERHLSRMARGDRLVLIPDPPGGQDPGVWLHLPTGEPVGHLPPEIADWLWPWLVQGGGAVARVRTLHGGEVPSWRRLVVRVECDEDPASERPKGG